ncbi:MAG: competence type IV pilus assembly protein ComGB [Enterococcus sp.]
MKPFSRRKSKARLAILEMFVLLLGNGFRLQESLQVMLRSRQFSDELLASIQQELAVGKSLSECFHVIGFSEQEVLQIQLAEVHGDLVETLQNLLNNNQLVAHQRTELQKVMTYPFVLLLFSMGMLLSMRWILLPQLLASNMVQTDHWGILFLTHSPMIFLLILLFGFVLVLVHHQWLKRKSFLQRAHYWSTFPLVGSWYCLYQTSYFALEWGKLFREGLEMKQILETLIQLPQQSLMVALANELNSGLRSGVILTEQLPQYSFLTPEFSFIVFQGELKGKLGEELLIYHQLLLNKLIQKVEKTLKWVQPIVFLLIAVVIVMIYVAMFLPIYGNIGGLI